MPKFYSLEHPPKETVEKLNKELREHPEVKPRLSFPFSLNEKRRGAMKMIQTEKTDEDKVLELLKGSDFVERRAGAYLLDKTSFSGEKKEIVLPILEALAKDKSEDGFIRRAATQALGNLGEKALPVLETLAKDKSGYAIIREEAIQALGYLGEKALSILEVLRKDESGFVRRATIQAIMRIKIKRGGYNYLLSTQKPLFATLETEQLAERIKKLQEITQKLKDKFGSKFIGLTIFGSTAKGYSNKRSDLDWGIIAKDKEVLDEFKNIAAESFHLCHEHYAGVDERNRTLSHLDVLFCGLFFGDQKELRKIQEIALQDMDEESWDTIRKDIMENETNLFKAVQRFEIQEEEIRKIKQLAVLLRAPPSYKETLEIVKRRMWKD